MTRFEAYKKARKEYLKKKEREANDYRRNACRSTEKFARQNRNSSQKYT